MIDKEFLPYTNELGGFPVLDESEEYSKGHDKLYYDILKKETHDVTKVFDYSVQDLFLYNNNIAIFNVDYDGSTELFSRKIDASSAIESLTVNHAPINSETTKSAPLLIVSIPSKEGNETKTVAYIL